MDVNNVEEKNSKIILLIRKLTHLMRKVQRVLETQEDLYEQISSLHQEFFKIECHLQNLQNQIYELREEFLGNHNY